MKTKWGYRDMEKYRECKRKAQRSYRKRTGAGQYPAREYTLEEDRMILEQSMTDRELGIKIQRSVGAIQQRRHDLKKRVLSLATYEELCATLTQFENSTDDPDDKEYLSDGEWLDIFYDLCVKMQREMN